jgi:membrane protein DedA with SNARE-associated domain
MDPEVSSSLNVLAQEITEFVRRNEIWAAPIVFALAFGESLAFISLLLPATFALVGIGALIGVSGIPFVPIWVAAALGAAFGDWLSYWLGIKFEEPIARLWPLSRYPTMLPNGHAFVERYGVFAIFLGRFFGPARAVVPLVAGILEMSYWPFQIANFVSAFVWAGLLLAPGSFGFRLFN